MPRDDYYLPISDQRAPVYKPFSSKLFDAPVGHHVAAPGAEVENQPTRQALKSFPKFSGKWFNNDDVVSYEGIGHEEWAGGLTGDLAESAEPIAGSAASEAVKNARVRRLEREFGADREGGLTKAMFRATQPLQVGELNKRGFIVTSGPRKRSAFRWLEGLLSLLALILLIYSALVRPPDLSFAPRLSLPDIDLEPQISPVSEGHRSAAASSVDRAGLRPLPLGLSCTRRLLDLARHLSTQLPSKGS